MTNSKPSRGQVDIIPSKPQRFAESHPDTQDSPEESIIERLPVALANSARATAN